MSKIDERKKLVLAMEYIVKNANDEEVIEAWLMEGVADGDIPYGCFDVAFDDLDIDYYVENEHFSELMGLFLHLMKHAYKSGGLYCGGVTDDLKN